MISLKNIQSLTSFKRNTVESVEQLKKTKKPLVLTVNGKAELVVIEAEQFEAMQERLDRAELVSGLSAGIEAFENGEFRAAREGLADLKMKCDL